MTYYETRAGAGSSRPERLDRRLCREPDRRPRAREPVGPTGAAVTPLAIGDYKTTLERQAGVGSLSVKPYVLAASLR